MSSTSQATAILKACVLPVCENKKFNLVHKFPADKERFTEWIEKIQESQPITKFAGLSDDAIRKRFFICSRHFGLPQYKNAESRSLNLTAIPHLNLKNLDEIHLSKAWQLENNSDFIAELIDGFVSEKPASNPKTVLPAPAVRILNSGVLSKETISIEQIKLTPTSSLASSPKKPRPKLKAVLVQEKNVEPLTKRAKHSQEDVINVTETNSDLTNERINVVKREPQPVSPSNTESIISMKKKLSITPTSIHSKVSSCQQQKEQTSEIVEIKPANKLLALLEVTPEQYEKLNKSLSSAERSENIANLINFIDNESEIADAENGEKSSYSRVIPFILWLLY